MYIIHGVKITKIRPPWHVKLDYFTTRSSIKKLKVIFYQVAGDGKNVLTISGHVVKKMPFRFLLDGLVI